MKCLHLFSLILIVLTVPIGCIHVPTPEEQFALLQRETGLSQMEVPDTKEPILAKVHSGYPVVFRIHGGEVWGRWASRIAMGEIGKEFGGIISIITGGYRHIGPHPVGSPLDRALSRLIGHPISITTILDHGKKKAPRLDIVSDFSEIQPDDPQPRQFSIAYFGAGAIYSQDRAFAERVNQDQELQSLLDCFRSEYIRVDSETVSFFFAGSENEYSHYINSCGGYSSMINRIMDALAKLADDIPTKS